MTSLRQFRGRKPTNNSIYIHWNAYGPRQWKTGTLSGIVRRAYDICSTEDSRDLELKFISEVFTGINGFPHYVVNSILNKIKNERTKLSTGKLSHVDENYNENKEWKMRKTEDRKSTC